MFANYHTHTARCHHATGEDKAYVEAAIQNGFQVPTTAHGFFQTAMFPPSA